MWPVIIIWIVLLYLSYYKICWQQGSITVKNVFNNVVKSFHLWHSTGVQSHWQCMSFLTAILQK